MNKVNDLLQMKLRSNGTLQVFNTVVIVGIIYLFIFVTTRFSLEKLVFLSTSHRFVDPPSYTCSTYQGAYASYYNLQLLGIILKENQFLSQFSYNIENGTIQNCQCLNEPEGPALGEYLCGNMDLMPIFSLSLIIFVRYFQTLFFVFLLYSYSLITTTRHSLI